MKRIAIIPARGGSKRIPRKNIIEFFGKPLISWTIEAALESKLFDRVLVSTDCEEIAHASALAGAEVPFLRDVHFDDVSSVSVATIAALKQASNYWNEDYDSVVQLMANCPLRTSQDIHHSINNFECSKKSFQISCFKYGWMNPWWAHEVSADKTPSPLFPNKISERSQDLPSLFCPTGAIWIADAASLIAEGSFYAQDKIFCELSWQSSVDIDDYSDLEFAKAVKSFAKNQNC